MTDPKDPTIIQEVMRQLVSAQVFWATLAFGAAGGATNALLTQVSIRHAIRLTLIGALVAFGAGSLSMALVAKFMGLPHEMIPAGGVGGSGAYLIGIFGGAFIDVMLSRLRKQKEKIEEGDSDA